MPEANLIAEHMEVVGADGVHVGTVDHIDGDRIKLTKADSNDGEHHYVSTALVQDIRGNSVTLTKPAAEAIAPRDTDADVPIVDPQIGVATSIG